MIDELIRRTGVDAPAAEPDHAALPINLDPPAELDLHRSGIGSIVWCTGFGGDFSWLDPVLVDAQGRPRHVEVASETAGVWYVGLRWLTHRGSAQLPGMPKDAATVARAIAAHLTVSDPVPER